MPGDPTRAVLEAVAEILAANGCDCECECHPDEHEDCDRCLACRIAEVVQPALTPTPEPRDAVVTAAQEVVAAQDACDEEARICEASGRAVSSVPMVRLIYANKALRVALAAISPDLSPCTVQRSETGHAGPGWYASFLEYPDEGSVHFDHEPTAKELAEQGMVREPAPAQPAEPPAPARRCDSCHGTGDGGGYPPVSCSACGGDGEADPRFWCADDHAPASQSQPAPVDEHGFPTAAGELTRRAKAFERAIRDAGPLSTEQPQPAETEPGLRMFVQTVDVGDFISLPQRRQKGP